MPPPGYHGPWEHIPLRKEFVIFPKRLLNGGWAWGTTYHRRVWRDVPNPSEVYMKRMTDEYLTEDEAVMAILEGE